MAKLNTKPIFNTRPIGDMFYIDIKSNRIFLEVVPEDPKYPCSGCYFDHNKCYENKFYRGECLSRYRSDNQGVIFKEVQPEPENYLCGDCPSKSCEGCPLYDNN